MTKGKTHELKIVRGYKPGAEESFRDVLRSASGSDRDLRIDFYADRHSEKHAATSWLRSSYLALFAVMGYRYVFQPGLARVRRHIRAPEIEGIPTFLWVLPGDHPWTERRIFKVLEPSWHQCWAVQVGRYVSFLPKAGDTQLYDRITGARQKGLGLDALKGESFEWPRSPSFGLP
jgi:hypothetical protein